MTLCILTSFLSRPVGAPIYLWLKFWKKIFFLRFFFDSRVPRIFKIWLLGKYKKYKKSNWREKLKFHWISVVYWAQLQFHPLLEFSFIWRLVRTCCGLGLCSDWLVLVSLIWGWSGQFFFVNFYDFVICRTRNDFWISWDDHILRACLRIGRRQINWSFLITLK